MKSKFKLLLILSAAVFAGTISHARSFCLSALDGSIVHNDSITGLTIVEIQGLGFRFFVNGRAAKYSEISPLNLIGGDENRIRLTDGRTVSFRDDFNGIYAYLSEFSGPKMAKFEDEIFGKSSGVVKAKLEELRGMQISNLKTGEVSIVNRSQLSKLRSSEYKIIRQFSPSEIIRTMMIEKRFSLDTIRNGSFSVFKSTLTGATYLAFQFIDPDGGVKSLSFIDPTFQLFKILRGPQPMINSARDIDTERHGENFIDLSTQQMISVGNPNLVH